jgi:hypothetical protein
VDINRQQLADSRDQLADARHQLTAAEITGADRDQGLAGTPLAGDA